MDFLNEKLPEGSTRSALGKAARVSELDLPTQRAFCRVLHRQGCSARSIAIYMSYIAAAINDAAKPRIVERDGREEETSILTHPVHIVAQDKVIAEALNSPLSQPRDWVPTMKQMATILDECAEHVFRYLVVALNTCPAGGKRQAPADHSADGNTPRLGSVVERALSLCAFVALMIPRCCLRSRARHMTFGASILSR